MKLPLVTLPLDTPYRSLLLTCTIAVILGTLVVQAPWALLNQLADRNMEIWKGVQQGIKSGLSAVVDKPEEPTRPAPRQRKRALRQ